MPSQGCPAPATGSSRRRERTVQPPRPPNAWILYRSSKFDLIRKTSERLSQATVSKRVSDMWRNETEQVRQHFERMADNRKAEHQRLYPDYRFSPRRKEEKARAKEGRKRGRRANMSKDHDATPADADASAGVDVDVDANATVAMPPPPPMPIPYMPQPYLLPGYQPNMVLPHPYMIHYIPEVYYGPGGLSPPISTAPSPAQSQSSKAQSYPEENMVSSSSNPSARPSPSSESQASSSSSQLPLNVSFLSSHSHQPSPETYATHPLPRLLLQSTELPHASSQVQFPSAENTVVPEAPVFSNHLSSLDSENLEEAVNFDIPFDETQNFTQFPQDLGGGPSFEESLQGMLSTTDENGVWNLSNVETSDFLIHPQGDLEVAMGSQDSTIDYNGELFADFDFSQLQQQMASFTESASSSTAVASVQEDFQDLLHAPNNPDAQVYTTTRQRQPSVFTQEMMNFFNFEAAGCPTEDTSTVFPVPVPATVAPQQVRLQSIQHAAAMPIFTQMTNAPAVVPCTIDTSYIPPTGATNSSMRRAAGSWKPTFDPLLSQVEESVLPWAFSTK